MDRKPRYPVEPGDRELAAAVRDHARRKGWFVTSQTDHWAPAVSRLRRAAAASGVSFEKLLSIWAWYECNFPVVGKTLPKIRSGNEFLKFFAWVLDRYEAAAATVPVGVDESRAAERLLARDWPGDSAKLVPVFVQQSADAVRAFLVAVRRVPVGLSAVAREIAAELSDAVTHAELWGDRVYRRVRGWSGWSGRLLDWVWRPDHPDAARDGRVWADRASGDPADWDAIVRFAATPKNGVPPNG